LWVWLYCTSSGGTVSRKPQSLGAGGEFTHTHTVSTVLRYVVIAKGKGKHMVLTVLVVWYS
jgi:hypothetical protein